MIRSRTAGIYMTPWQIVAVVHFGIVADGSGRRMLRQRGWRLVGSASSVVHPSWLAMWPVELILQFIRLFIRLASFAVAVEKVEWSHAEFGISGSLTGLERY